MDTEEWNELPNNGPQFGDPRHPPPTQRVLQPTGTFAPVSAAWAPARPARSLLNFVPAPGAPPRNRSTNGVAMRWLERSEKQRKEEKKRQFPTGANKLANKTKKIKNYEGVLRNLEAVKALHLPSNILSSIAPFITGEKKASINQQENRLKQGLDTLKSVDGNIDASRQLYMPFEEIKPSANMPGQGQQGGRRKHKSKRVSRRRAYRTRRAHRK